MENGKRWNTLIKTKQKRENANNEFVESLSEQNSKPQRTSRQGPQPQFTKGWAVTEELLGSLQLLLIATYPAIVRLESVSDPR